MAKYQFPEFDTNFKFVYDKSKSFKDLILGKRDNSYLLNVRKKYTNGLYFGASFVALFLRDKPVISCTFTCRDRGFPEDLVDNKDKVVTHILENHIRGCANFADDKNNERYTHVKQDINLGLINDRSFDVEFVYNEKGYWCTNFVLTDPHAVFRGLYGTYDVPRFVELYGIGIHHHDIPSLEQLQYLRDQAHISFSNVYHDVNTEYSQIKVFENDT